MLSCVLLPLASTKVDLQGQIWGCSSVMPCKKKEKTSSMRFLSFGVIGGLEFELGLILSHMAQKPMLRGEEGARALHVGQMRGGMGKCGYVRCLVVVKVWV